MAISAIGSATIGSTTASYTVGAEANHLLALVVVGGLNTDTVSAATYGGQSMTLTGKCVANANRYLYIFHLLNPPSGANAFNITDGGNFNNGFAMDYAGVNQSGQPDASGTVAGTAVTTLSKTLTTTADNCWLISGIFAAASGNLTAGANTTIRLQNGQSSASADSNSVQTPPGNFAQTFNSSGTWADASLIVAAFSPAPGGRTGLQAKLW